jgi:hypothetical protein
VVLEAEAAAAAAPAEVGKLIPPFFSSVLNYSLHCYLFLMFFDAVYAISLRYI